MKKSNAFQILDGKLVYSFQSRKSFMSNPYLAVEKVIESPIKNIILRSSLGLAASDKTQRRGLSSPTNLFSFPSIGAASCTSLSEDLCCPIVVQGSFISSQKTVHEISPIETK